MSMSTYMAMEDSDDEQARFDRYRRERKSNGTVNLPTGGGIYAPWGKF